MSKDDAAAGSSLNVVAGAEGAPGTANSEKKDDKGSANQESRKMGSFPGDLSTMKTIFSMKSKS